MPNYNGVEKFTVVNGGGTINLDVTKSTTTRYVFSGTATLSSGYTIQATGTPVEGMEFDIRWQSVCTTAGANVVTIFGTTLTTDQALNDLIITCYYNGSGWDVDIQQDGIQEIWENGSGSNSVQIIAGTGTATGTDSINIGFSGTASGQSSLVSGSGNTASGIGSTALGSSSTASGDLSFASGAGCTASGVGSNARNNDTIASGAYSTAEGNTTTASGDNSHSGGLRAISARYGQQSRASGKHNIANATDYAQFTKLTARATTTDATPGLLYLDGSTSTQLITIPSNCIAYFRGEAVAIQQAGSAGTVGDSASWHFNGCIKNVAGTTALVDTVRYQDNTGAWGAAAQRTQDAAIAAITLVPTANNGTDTLDITVTGEANKTIYWLCNIELTEIRYTP